MIETSDTISAKRTIFRFAFGEIREMAQDAIGEEGLEDDDNILAVRLHSEPILLYNYWNFTVTFMNKKGDFINIPILIHYDKFCATGEYRGCDVDGGSVNISFVKILD